MSNQVQVNIDSRVFYGLIALLAVVGIFAVGLWLGGQLGGGDEPAAANPQPVIQADITGGGASDTGTITNNVPDKAVVTQPGSNPVSQDEVPVDEGQPRIWIPEAAEADWQWEFGSIPPDQKAEHEFAIENIGSGVLEITDASASCGCTAALVEDSTIEPGESTTIRVSYDPRVNQEFGRFVTKQIRVKSNDPLVPLAEFTITADVQSQ